MTVDIAKRHNQKQPHKQGLIIDLILKDLQKLKDDMAELSKENSNLLEDNDKLELSPCI